MEIRIKSGWRAHMGVLRSILNVPTPLRENMRLRLQNKDFYVSREGVEELPQVTFREVNPFKLWVRVEREALASERRLTRALSV